MLCLPRCRNSFPIPPTGSPRFLMHDATACPLPKWDSPNWPRHKIAPLSLFFGPNSKEGKPLASSLSRFRHPRRTLLLKEKQKPNVSEEKDMTGGNKRMRKTAKTAISKFAEWKVYRAEQLRPKRAQVLVSHPRFPVFADARIRQYGKKKNILRHGGVRVFNFVFG